MFLPNEHALNFLLIFPDQEYIVKKCPYLVNEMINVIAQLVAGAHRNGSYPSSFTIPNI